MMWDVLDAANMCRFYWLVNKAGLVNDQAQQSQAGNPNKDVEKNKVELGQRHVTAKGVTCQDITSKPYPCGDAQIGRNGLI